MAVVRTIGRPDAFCATCRAEVVVGADLACPTCGDPVDPRSLAKVPAPVPDAPNGTAQTVALPAIREAVTWDRATTALLDALEVEEQAALVEYERARERVKTARRAAGAMRQLRGLVTIAQGVPALVAPKAKRRGRPPRQSPAVTDSTEAGETQPSRPATYSEKPWSRQYAACVNCGTTGTKSGTTAHAARGRCFLCYAYHVKHHVERPRDLWAVPAAPEPSHAGGEG